MVCQNRHSYAGRSATALIRCNGGGGYPDQGCSGPKGTWEFCQWVQVQIVRDLQTGYRRHEGDQWEPEVGPRRWAAKAYLGHLFKPVVLPVFDCKFN